VAKILIVDDSPVILRLLHQALKAEHDITICKDSIQGVELAQNELPDIILLDVIMPDLTGLEALLFLKNNAKTRSIPVILISAKDTADDEARGYKAGATDYIRKPFDAGVVRHKVNYALEFERMKLKIQQGEG